MKKAESALVSVFNKDGLDDIARLLHKNNVTIYSTGGSQKYIENLGIPVIPVEDLTEYPSIFGGRVKTLHPKVFGGILNRRDHIGDQNEAKEFSIPNIDLVIVDLYPFEETVSNTNNEEEIIEKIDIGGIALIRGAAKNFNDVLIVPAKQHYNEFLDLFDKNQGQTSLEERKRFATYAFSVSSHYDSAIFNYFNKESGLPYFKSSFNSGMSLRYGENPHQEASFFGSFENYFDQISGKQISYNNLVDIDAAVNLIRDFSETTFAILKHTNSCGLASRGSVLESYKAALECDSISAFGGILICNKEIDMETAEEINSLFYEVLIAPSFDEEALALLTKKTKRIILKQKHFDAPEFQFKSLLNGVIQHDYDNCFPIHGNIECVTQKSITLMDDLIFASKAVKHLKSNGIALVKDQQLIGMGCGQTSRVDALKQAILKAKTFGFDLTGSVMASDAFFPFPDCVEIAKDAGVIEVIQPGGSIKDQLSIDYCNENNLAMAFTGERHFKH